MSWGELLLCHCIRLIAFYRHVDAGKSTLMGHVLYLLDRVQDKTLRKYEKEAERMKKGSFVFAWVLDETEEERNRYLNSGF